MIEWLLIRVLKTLQLLMMRKSGPDRRGQHAKHHGCVAAQFIVADDLPDDLQTGVFAESNKSFPALIRFSNGAKEDDREDDVHGMAIKLLGVEGRKVLQGEERETTHDFILADNPVFLARSVWHLLQYIRWKKNREKVLKTHPACDGFSKPAPENPLAATYFSQTPYRLRHRIVRYEAHPHEQNSSGSGPREDPDFLKQAMIDLLNEREARFDFMVQRAPDDSAKWEKDPTITWPTEPVRVATIVIPPQQFDTTSKRELAEDLSFTPWHCLPEHLPLGQINRARRVVYLASAKYRRRQRRIEALAGEPLDYEAVGGEPTLEDL